MCWKKCYPGTHCWSNEKLIYADIFITSSVNSCSVFTWALSSSGGKLPFISGFLVEEGLPGLMSHLLCLSLVCCQCWCTWLSRDWQIWAQFTCSHFFLPFACRRRAVQHGSPYVEVATFLLLFTPTVIKVTRWQEHWRVQEQTALNLLPVFHVTKVKESQAETLSWSRNLLDRKLHGGSDSARPR